MSNLDYAECLLGGKAAIDESGRSTPETFVDFDHTLLAANSTELFVGFCRPYFFAAIVDFLVRHCLPWRLLPAAMRYRARDYFCCIALMVLMPWNIWRWRSAAPSIFAAHRSVWVDEMILASTNIVIVSFGSQMIIEPMLRDSRWSASRLLATPTWCSPFYFRRGKLAIVSREFDLRTIGLSRFITDSEEDRDLLDASGDGIKIPMQGERNSASEHLYIPLRYTLGVKYPRSYALDQFLFTDVLLATLAIATGLGSLLPAIPAVALLVLSIMCVYEIGYFENDFVDKSVESAPTLTPTAGRYRKYPIMWGAWIWAGATGGLGIYLAERTGLLALNWLSATVTWAVILGATRITFRFYNRLRPEARIAWYAVLQIEKTALLFVLITPTVTGMAMVASHVLAMWVVYILYRIGRVKDAISREWLRFGMFFVIVGCLILAMPDLLVAETIPLALFLAWSLLRCVKAPLMKSLRGLKGKRRQDNI